MLPTEDASRQPARRFENVSKREIDVNKLFQIMHHPEFYPHAVQAVEREETHISVVFMTGSYVYKIKKSVALGFLDFTTLEKRRFFCHQELVLNRRLSQNVYLGVAAITEKDNRYYLDGPGEPIEYAVKMRQLPADRSMRELLKQNKLLPRDIERLALFLCEFYQNADSGDNISAFGAGAVISKNWEENFSQTEDFAGPVIDRRHFEIVRAAVRAFLERHKTLFQRRIDKKKIRDCHGDLRSDHIYFFEGLQIIDCIEFNDRFRYGDITSDLAFLSMDLDCRDGRDTSQALMEAYVQCSGDRDVFVLLDFYKCYRAFVRMKVDCLRLRNNHVPKTQKDDIVQSARRYMDFAYRYAVQFTRPTLWVVCGMAASGKTTIAGELAGTLNVNVFHSDQVRKALFEVNPEEHGPVGFEAGIYSKGATALTYGKLLLLAQEQLEKGRSVILDATYSKVHDRTEAIRLARDRDVNVLFIECTCSDRCMKERLESREEKSSDSEARLQHFEALKRRYEPPDELPESLHLRVNTEKSVEANMAYILASDYALLTRQTTCQVAV
jgi:uncharacterized protein